MFYALKKKETVGKSGKSVVQSGGWCVSSRVEQVGASLRVHEIGRGDIGQGLCDRHGIVIERSGRVSIEIECAKWRVTVAQGKSEYSGETCFERLGNEERESLLCAEV